MQPERRTDTLTADVIDRAVELDQTRGAITAWIYLMRQGVPTDVIQRVLLITEGQLVHPARLVERTNVDRRRR